MTLNRHSTKNPANLPFGLDIAGFNFAQKQDITPIHTDTERNRKDPKNKLNTFEWAQKYRAIRGRKFSLDKHKPLEQIYKDDHPHIVVMKPAQVGVSEFTLTKTIWALDIGAEYWGLDQNGINVAYLFPTEKALSEFSKERFAKLKRENNYFESFFAEYDDVTFKQSGDSVLYLRGASSETQLLSFPCDFLILDEFDRMPTHSVSLAQQRLRASELKREIDISTPTLPGIGIDAIFQQSDQHYWQIQCGKCQEWVELDFFKDVRLDNELYDEWSQWLESAIRKAPITMHCPLCAAEVDRLADGRWQARFPDREGLRGYHVPWYGFPTVDIRKLCIDAISQDPTKRTELYRSGLGQPYTEKGSRITEDMLAALSIDLPHGLPKNVNWIKTTIGIDVNKSYYYRVSSVNPKDNKRYVRAMGKAGDLEDLDIIIRSFKVRRGVIDGLPEIHSVPKWLEKYKGRIVRAYYTHGPRMQKDQMIKYDPKKRIVSIHRTMGMDTLYANVAEEKEVWPKEYSANREIVSNMTAPVRTEQPDDTGQMQAIWQHTKPDDFFHACVYDTIAGMIAPDGVMGVLAQGSTKGWNPK